MRTTKTNKIGAGTVNFSINMPDDMHDDLKAEAEKRGVSLGELVRAFITEAVDRGEISSSLLKLRRDEAARALLEAATKFAAELPAPTIPTEKQAQSSRGRAKK